MRSMWRHTSRGSPVRTLPQSLETGRRAISRLMLRTRAPPLVRPCGGPWRGFAARTKKLQDIRGEYQDAVVAEERLRSLVDGDYRRPVRLLANRFIGRQRGRREVAQMNFFGQWPKLKLRGHQTWEHQ